MIRSIGHVGALCAVACLVSTSHPLPVLAADQADYAQPTDCPAERAAARNLGIPTDELFKEPWTYKYNRIGALESPAGFRATAAASERYAGRQASQGRNRDQVEATLRACIYRAAANRMEAKFARVTAGQTKALVGFGHCQVEQDAFVTAYVGENERERAIYKEQRDLTAEARAIVAGMITGVQYNYYMNLPGRRLERENFQNIANGGVSAARTSAEFNNRADAALGSLGACLYRTAADRLGTPAPETVGPQPASAAAICSEDNLVQMNREIADRDSRLQAFLDNSSYAKATGLKNATPMLVVTMWALRGQIDAIRRYCPDTPDQKGRIADLQLSYDAAQKACDQIQAGGGRCKPTEPEAL